MSLKRVLMSDVKGDSCSPDCPNPILPLPAEFCEGCGLNGCYIWNRNPLLLCYLMGGIGPTIFFAQDDVVMECPRYIPASTMWDSFLIDKKREAEWNEESRKRSTLESPVWSSELLPAEDVQSRYMPSEEDKER